MKLGKNERKTTFLLITIPILALFICFNTIPLIRGVIYSFTNFRGFGKYDWVGLETISICFRMFVWASPTGLRLSCRS